MNQAAPLNPPQIKKSAPAVKLRVPPWGEWSGKEAAELLKNRHAWEPGVTLAFDRPQPPNQGYSTDGPPRGLKIIFSVLMFFAGTGRCCLTSAWEDPEETSNPSMPNNLCRQISGATKNSFCCRRGIHAKETKLDDCYTKTAPTIQLQSLAGYVLRWCYNILAALQESYNCDLLPTSHHSCQAVMCVSMRFAWVNCRFDVWVTWEPERTDSSKLPNVMQA